VKQRRHNKCIYYVYENYTYKLGENKWKKMAKCPMNTTFKLYTSKDSKLWLKIEIWQKKILSTKNYHL